MIIDAHAHCDNTEWLGYIDSPDRIVSLMDLYGIDMAVISSYNDAPDLEGRVVDYIDQGAKKYLDRLIPFIRVNPAHGEGTLEVIKDAILNRNFKGIKLHPANYILSAFGQETMEILDLAAEYDVPVLFHCTEDVKSAPLFMGFAAQNAPDTKMILAHMGGFFLTKDAINVCKQNRNIYLDTSEIPFVDAIREAAEVLGPERILFGSDLPTDNPQFEIEKIKAANLGKEAENLIFWKNIARLLKLDLEGADK